jgi:LemA family protein
MITYISIGIGAILLLYIISAFNRLSKHRNQIQNAISSLDSLFIQRADLIPNLIATTKEYMNYEQETLAQITGLRTPEVTKEQNPYLQSEEGNKMLMNIMARAEEYPELKASNQFIQLQRAFTECEEQLAAGRRYLSASITDYNDALVTFPSNIIAGIFGFSKYQWQYATAQQRTAVNAEELFQK